METTKYVVYSTGEIISGFELELVIENLNGFLRIPQDLIEQTLINGSPKKIKTAKSEDQAERLIAKLRSLGLDCYFSESDIETPAWREPAPTPGFAPTHEIPPAPQEKSRWSLWLISFAAIITLLGAIAYFASSWLEAETPQQVNQVEAALFAVNQPSLFMHANVAQTQNLMTLASNDSAHSSGADTLLSVIFLESLGKSEYLFNQTDFVSVSLNVSELVPQEQAQQEWLTVLNGRFDSTKVRQEFNKSYDLEALQNGIIKLTSTSKNVDGLECPLDAEEKARSVDMFVHISKSQVVIGSSPELATQLISKLSTEIDAPPQQLSQWQAYRKGSLLAVQLFDQNPLDQNFFSKAAKSSMFGETKLDSLGFKVDSALMSKGVTVTFNASSSDAAQLKSVSETLNQGLQTKLEENKESLPSVAKLLSRIEISYGDSLNIVASLDDDLLGEIGDLSSDFMGLFMNTQQNSSAEPEAEKLDDYVWDYALNASFIAPEADETSSFDKFLPLFSKGAVSLYIESVGSKPLSPFASQKDLGKAMQLELKAKRSAPKLDNTFGWSQSGMKQRFMITEVLNAQGANLIVDERCSKQHFGKSRNHEPESSATLNNRKIETTKNVRLIDAIHINDIDRVKGWYEIDIPTSVSETNLSMTGDRDAAWQGGSLRLMSINHGNVSYTVSGDEANLITVKALNANGQALSSSSSFSGGGKVSKTFSGEVASIDVVVAQQWHKDRFDFDLETITPKAIEQNDPFKSDTQVSLFSIEKLAQFDTPLDFGSLDKDALDSLQRNLGWKKMSLDGSQPFDIGRTNSKSAQLIFKHDPSNKWNNTLDAKIFVPFEEVVLGNPQTISIVLNIDGTEHPAVTPSISATRFNGKFKASYTSGDKGYVEGSFKISLAEELSSIQNIDGEIVYTLPTAIETFAIDLSEQESERAVYLNSLDYGWQKKAVYTASEEISNVYAAKLFTTDGQEHLAEVVIDDDGRTSLAFQSFENHQRIELYVVQDSHIVREKFSLTPSYKTQE